MTQHFIRKNAGWGPLRRAIERLHEPRIISAFYGAAYTGKMEDQDIEYVVESGWRTVAEKYAPIVEPEAESGDQ